MAKDAEKKVKCPVCGEEGAKHKPGCSAPRTDAGHADVDAIADHEDAAADRATESAKGKDKE